MTIEEMKRLKRERGFTNEYISEHSRIPVGTVRKIFSGETKSPRYETMQRLEKFFERNTQILQGPAYDYPLDGSEPIFVREKIPDEIYFAGPVGPYTTEDYKRRREDERIELLDGFIYNLAAPTPEHQFILLKIVVEMELFLRENGGDCLVFPAPVSVYLKCDDKTVVEPDISILCDREKLFHEEGAIWGAPDLVMEILSPSTRIYDMNEKCGKYSSAGVREYWIIDPELKRVIVFDFNNRDFIQMYTFRDTIPVKIWDSKCKIDFSRIADSVAEIFGEGSGRSED